VGANGCFEFAILDSWGDGLLGDGYYKVLLNGAVTVSGGGNYGSGETKKFGVCA